MEQGELTEQRPQGAMEELRNDPSSRKRFLRSVGGVGAAGAFAAFLAACGDDKSSTSSSSGSSTSTTMQNTMGTEQFGKGDIGILNYALTLEYLETAFYQQAAKSGKLKGDVLAVAKVFGKQEAEHVAAIEATVKKLGGTPAKKPVAEFPLDSQKAILDLAATVENLGAAAYLGQAGNIKNKEVLAAALSIHTVEARHAAALNTVIGKPITPDGAFAKPADAAQVLAAVKPFIQS
jgi:rubrerythrin